ncbi:MAG TPA: metal-dependent hydrolase [Oscillatoriaceae cyanobacterium]
MTEAGTGTHLRARPVKFDWSDTPLHWVPNQPFMTHFLNYFHVVIPPAERLFVRFGREGLERVKSEAVRQALKGFIAQEAMHSRAQAGALELLKRQGFETEEAVELAERVLGYLIGEPTMLPLPEAFWRAWRLALGAAGEQITCVLGNWVLTAEALDRAGVDPTMLDLLRWHGAEEIEHRSVLFDVHQDVNGPVEYPLRVAAIVVIFAVLAGLWVHGTGELIAQDATLEGRRFDFFAEYAKLAEAELAPGLDLLKAMLRYLEPAFHPRDGGFDAEAADYLGRSPGLRAAIA